MNPLHRRRWMRLRRRLLQRLALTLPHGARLFPTTVPLSALSQRNPHGVAKSLLIVLPGIRDLPGDFTDRGLTDAAWRAGLGADVIELDLHLGYYLHDAVVERLHEDVVRAAYAKGYERIWIVGISLGGLGALLYARAHPDAVDGVVLLAPFLGHDNFIRTLRQAGRARHWATPVEAGFQDALWSWLVTQPRRPALYLGFGSEDPFAPANRLLAELLPKGRVFVTPGSHDWATWSHLWQTILSRVLTQPRHWA